MVKAQEWLDREYPNKEVRERLKELNISNKNLERDLDLSDFKGLKELKCWGNKLTNLSINNCIKLKVIGSWNNQLTNLDLSSLNKLKEVSCFDNYLAKLIYLHNSEKLTILNIKNNNFPKQDLTAFSQFKNLECLNIGNDYENKINQDIYNRFYGSLEPLKVLNKLWKLNISNTDINSGVEYLPESLEEIDYDAGLRPTCKLTEIKEQLYLFTSKELQKWWKKLGFTLEQGLAWVQTGAKPDDYDFVSWLRDTKKRNPSMSFKL